MEAVWLLAGVILGCGVGYLVGDRNRIPRSSGSSDREIDRLEIEERLEKLDHMIDRYRKRAAALGPRPGREPALNESSEILDVDPKAALRRKARESGLLVGNLEGFRSGQPGVERDASRGYSEPLG